MGASRTRRAIALPLLLILAHAASPLLSFLLAPSSVRVQRQQTSTSASAVALPSNPRRVARVRKFGRLPVWPVQNGLFFFVLEKLGLKNLAAKLEDEWGGRVCPMFLLDDQESCDPFIMLVHHRHSFSPLDPFRAVSKLVLPEGFPAHPHRGFQTCTIVLKGEIAHRDSLGIKQIYGNGEVQWLHAGRGILHEEMFNLPSSRNDIELYQIWVNVPADKKMTEPIVQLLPLPEGGKLSVIAGEVEGSRTVWKGQASDFSILRVCLNEGEVWTHNLPAAHNCFAYIRKGKTALSPVGTETAGVHDTIFWKRGQGDCIQLVAGAGGLDALVLHGQPIDQHIVASGPFVVESQSALEAAYADYQAGKLGRPWDHNATDEEWLGGLL
jgi:redox-sensitive bicupin YhaK (pirin superfamily)